MREVSPAGRRVSTKGSRPRRTLLAVLVDRGGRELPIQADVVGERVEVPEGGRVEVMVPEIDGTLGVDLVEAG